MEEARRRLPAIPKLMQSTHVTNLFRRQLTDDNQRSAVLAVKSNIVKQVHREIEREEHQTPQQSTRAQQASKRPHEGYNLRSTINAKKQKAAISGTTLKDLGPEESLQCIINSKDCKDKIVDFTKPIAKRFKPAIPKIVEHYNFSLASAITLEERRILIDLSLCRIIDDEEKLFGSLFQKIMYQKTSGILELQLMDYLTFGDLKD